MKDNQPTLLGLAIAGSIVLSVGAVILGLRLATGVVRAACGELSPVEAMRRRSTL